MHLDFPAFRGDIEKANLHIRAIGYKPYDCALNVPRLINATAVVGPGPLLGNRYRVGGDCQPGLTPDYPTRTGLTRSDGKEVRDDTGSYHPLGLTFFWAMQGLRNDPRRFQQNVDFLARYHYDYVRILAQVDWPGNDIDPSWPDYADLLARVIDIFYAKGIRVEITILGSPYPDPVGLAHRVAAVTASRAQKVIAIETWNEWSQNGGSLQAMIDMTRVLLAESGVPLVGLSSNGGDGPIAAASETAGATLRTVHTDRGAGDNGWRMVRQAFDFKDLPGVVDSNEPPGPNSSVGTLSSPLQLAMMRALGAQEGGALFVLHVGDMVAGQRDPAHHRMPNLWQAGCENGTNTPDNPCPYIDRVLKAVRSIDPYLPEGVGNWRPKTAANVGIPPQALQPPQAGFDVSGPTVNRAYAAIDGPRFMQTLLGIRGPLPLTLTMPGVSTCHIKALQPETGEMLEFDLTTGATWTAQGRDDTQTGYILTGTCQ
jgi:hypothetical protein